MCGFIVLSLTTKVAGFEPTHEGVKVPCLTAWLYLNNKNDVADWYSAHPSHLRQTNPHPDYIVTTYLPNIEDGMLSPSILGEERTQYHCFSPVNQFLSIIPCRLTDSNH